MNRMYEGSFTGQGKKIALVVGRFNECITSKLVEGAKDCLLRHGVEPDHIEIAWVPGAFEIPLIAQKMAFSAQYDAIICLGAVIRGETPHFQYVCSQAAKGIASVSLNTGLPILFGIITTDTLEQALNRAGLKHGNKGWEAALCALEMCNLIAQIEHTKKKGVVSKSKTKKGALHAQNGRYNF